MSESEGEEKGEREREGTPVRPAQERRRKEGRKERKTERKEQDKRAMNVRNLWGRGHRCCPACNLNCTWLKAPEFSLVHSVHLCFQPLAGHSVSAPKCSRLSRLGVLNWQFDSKYLVHLHATRSVGSLTFTCFLRIRLGRSKPQDRAGKSGALSSGCRAIHAQLQPLTRPTSNSRSTPLSTLSRFGFGIAGAGGLQLHTQDARCLGGFALQLALQLGFGLCFESSRVVDAVQNERHTLRCIVDSL